MLRGEGYYLQVVVLLGLLFRPSSCRRTRPWLVPLLLLLLVVNFHFCFGYCSWGFRFLLFLCTITFAMWCFFAPQAFAM